MKNIIAIFKDDVRGLTKNILALVLALGLCVLPSLYAWFNIYSNWDPYANTANVPIAVFSEDAGYVKSDGTEVNMGESVLDSLRENDKLGWSFPGSSQEAIDGVYSGEYYAALIMGEDFSENMYNCLANGMEHPKIQYYENEKRNAIAVKITDSGSSSLQNTINTEFIDVVVTTLSENINEIASDEEGSLISGLEKKIRSVNENLIAYENLLDSFMECNISLSETILDMKDVIPKIQSAINSSISSINSAKATAGQYADIANGIADSFTEADAAAINTKIGTTLNILGTSAQAANAAINAAQKQAQTDSTNTAAIAGELNTAAGYMGQISSSLDALAGTVEKWDSAIAAELKLLSKTANAAQSVIGGAATKVSKASAIKGALSAGSTIVSASIDAAVAQLPVINQVIYGDLSKKVADAARLAQLAGDQANQQIHQATAPTAYVDIDESGLSLLLDSVSNSLLAGNIALDNSKTILHQTTEKFSGLLEQLEGITDEEKYQKIMDALKNDPTLYGEFLSQPVTVETIPVYETATYGAAVTPFYTTLALWVGAIILVAIVKVHAKPKNSYKKAKHYELFLGRYLIFFFMGQLQAAICVWGDLNLLHVQCEDPGLFYLAGSLISFTFTMMIYTLTLSFGDIGKAFAVVIMVIQIAGSSGTYPIELLPDIFQAIYKYFPFPYAINAMREVISGRYENDYWIFLGQLMIFVVASLAVGLLIRIPFMKINHFIEKRMEDTQMM